MKSKKLSAESCWFLCLTLINTCIASAICLSNFPEDALFWSIQSLLFALTANLGHFYFLFALASLPFWLLGKLSFFNKLRFSSVVIVQILVLCLIYLDARIYELYKFHLNGMVIELITGGALQDILKFSLLVWGLFLAIAICFFIFQFILGKVIWYFCQEFELSKIIASISLIVFLASALISQGIYIISDAKADPTITSLKRYIPWAQTITAKRRLRELGVTIEESNTQEINYRSHEIYYPKNTLQCQPEHKYNYMIIVVDSLRFDMLDKVIMPNMWGLSEQGHRYSEHFAQANSTRFGIFTLLYGLPGSYWHSMLNINKGTVLLDVLQQQNYEFYIKSAAPLYSPEFDRTAFVDITEAIDIGPSNTPAHIKDRYITDTFKQSLAKHNRNKPFFSFMFYDSPHSFSYPESFEEVFTPSWKHINYLQLDNDFDPSEFFNRYKNSAAYTDSLIAEVISSLKKEAYFENTIIVFTSDHGQEFNETGQNFWGHNGNFSRYQTQVPFFIYWPETHPLHESRTYQHQTSNMDVVPTLMNEALGCTNPISDYSLGLNLYAAQNDYSRPLAMESWSKRAVMGKDYILVSHDAGGTELFDRDYNRLENFSPPQKDLAHIFHELSAFKHSGNSITNE